VLMFLEKVSLSAFAFLFSEFIQYSQTRAASFNDLEKRFVDFSLFFFLSCLWSPIVWWFCCFFFFFFFSLPSSCRISDAGYGIGVRLLELISFREKNFKRETKLIGIISFIHGNVWRVMFGKQADALERSSEQDDECKRQKRTLICPLLDAEPLGFFFFFFFYVLP
jgi:hypothetical protein